MVAAGGVVVVCTETACVRVYMRVHVCSVDIAEVRGRTCLPVKARHDSVFRDPISFWSTSMPRRRATATMQDSDPKSRPTTDICGRTGKGGVGRGQRWGGGRAVTVK